MKRVQILKEDGTIAEKMRAPVTSKKKLMKWYRDMVMVQTLDEKGLQLQRQGRIGFHIPTTGQEAHIGVAAALEDSDWIFPAYREHGCAIYRGLDIQGFIHQIFANGSDVQKGRRLPGLFGEKNVNFVNPSAPIGTQIIHAAGAGFASKYLKDKTVTAVFFGDGATSSNDFHSGMNFAAVFKTPTIFVCQNNQWAISVPLSKQTVVQDLYHKGASYGIPSVQVDGNDVFALYSETRKAAKRGREGKGPTYIEAVTYRLGPHTSSDDPTRYRKEEDVEKWRAQAPVERFKKYLISQEILSEKEDKLLRDEYSETVLEYITEAEETAPPDIKTLFTDVYSEMYWHLKEQLEDAMKYLEN